MINRDALINQFIYLAKYALSSLLGVLFDFGLYMALAYNSLLSPGLANAVSTLFAGSVGWFIAGKTVFRKSRIKNNGYLIWSVYIILVTAIYSIIIQSMVWLGLDKYIAKILMTGISFCINSCFFQYVVLKKFSNKHVELACFLLSLNFIYI